MQWVANFTISSFPIAIPWLNECTSQVGVAPKVSHALCAECIMTCSSNLIPTHYRHFVCVCVCVCV